MKRFLTNLGLKARIAFLTLMSGLVSVSASAQTDPLTQKILDGGADAMNGVVPGIIRIMKIAVIIGGAISLLLVVFNIIQGERDAAKKAGWWVVGLALGFAVLTILGNMSA